MSYSDLDGEQTRQTLNTEQAFEAYRAARDELKHRFAGSMAWKTIAGITYLYRGQRGIWKSLGPRTPETEEALVSFRAGRLRTRARMTTLAKRLDRMAAVNRALDLGRIPVIAARILRALSDARLTETAILTVGTNALYAYERMAGVQIADAILATEDIDFLYDARASLKLLAPDVAATGVAGLLRKVDRSFEIIGKDGFRATNRDGYIVDLITPAPKDPMLSRGRKRIGSEAGDLTAVEIEGLNWLVNAPKITEIVMDQRGYPASMIVPDPRAFALHKFWLSKRDDRNPAKRRRDEAQAGLIVGLLAKHLPHLRFDDPALAALPRALRDEAARLAPARREAAPEPSRLEPDW